MVKNANVVTVVKLKNIKNAIGKTVSTQGKVYGTKDIRSMYFVNLGAAYPKQILTVVLKGQAMTLGSQLENKTLTVEGEVTNYQGKPQIIVTDPAKIRF